ncbi:hypothetical protein B0T19DRAFT_281753 [Cercophora scortea]|uniref:Uncharacterized protein n=1 Tax=Cercophora scortea TaxID=314031 RepID=A0AAE0I7U1_9PEZI|nr:hypothetical protein B0T19DRAFT_281753 [Cercophora scortea]
MMLSEQLRRGRGSGIQQPTEARKHQAPNMASSRDNERFQRVDSEQRKLRIKEKLQRYAADEAREKRGHPTPPASSPPADSPQREREPSDSALNGTAYSRSIDSYPRESEHDGPSHKSGSPRSAARCGEGLAVTVSKENSPPTMMELFKQQEELIERQKEALEQRQILDVTIASINEASRQNMRRMEEAYNVGRDRSLQGSNQRLPPSEAVTVVPRPMPRSNSVQTVNGMPTAAPTPVTRSEEALEINERPAAVLQPTRRQKQTKSTTVASVSHRMTLRKKMPEAELVLHSIEKIEEDWGSREEPIALDLVVSDIIGESEREPVSDVASGSATANIKMEGLQEEDSGEDEDNTAGYGESTGDNDEDDDDDDEYEQANAAVPVLVGSKRKADGQPTGPPPPKKRAYQNMGKWFSTSEIPNPFLKKVEEQQKLQRLRATGARSRVNRR